MNRNWRDVVSSAGPPLGLLLVVLAGWQIASWWFDWPEFLMPAPTDVATAIANDGDALFPAIAVASKAALVATLYSGVPAVMVAYSWFLLVELEP